MRRKSGYLLQLMFPSVHTFLLFQFLRAFPLGSTALCGAILTCGSRIVNIVAQYVVASEDCQSVCRKRLEQRCFAPDPTSRISLADVVQG